VRALHLFSNFKWTGPAEPAVELVRRLRALGHTCDLAISTYAKGGDHRPLLEEARARGVEPILRFELPKHFAPLRGLRDARALAHHLEETAPDVLHAHLSNDHLVAAVARRFSASKPALVRSIYEGEIRGLSLRDRLCLRRTEAVLVPGRRPAEELAAAGFPAARLKVIEPPLDLDRFDPSRVLPDARPDLGFDPEDFVVGVVARVQRRRRFDLLFEAVRAGLEKVPRLRLLVVGRGTHVEDVARRPARRLGLDVVARFPGYLSGERYLAGIAAMDALVFLVPGTDGTCRALREAMAMGKPAVVSRRGILGELVDHGRTGFVVEEAPKPIARSLVELACDPAMRRRMGAEASADARRRWHPLHQAEAVAAVYAEVRRRGA
jgi:glycosyltransferase involved in cell wall biosynthesis